MGRGAITDWRKKLAVGLPRSFLDSKLKDMVKKTKWVYPDIGGLTGEKYQGLSELRWKCSRVPHRIIGYSLSLPRLDASGGLQRGIFVMLIGCTHDDKKYTPTECLNTAAERKIEIEQGIAETSEYKLLVG